MESGTSEEQRGALLRQVFEGADMPDSVQDRLLRTADVALLFQVSERTVSEWAKKGRIVSIRTPGGHRRYPANQVRKLLAETGRTDVGDGSPAPV